MERTISIADIIQIQLKPDSFSPKEKCVVSTPLGLEIPALPLSCKTDMLPVLAWREVSAGGPAGDLPLVESGRNSEGEEKALEKVIRSTANKRRHLKSERQLYNETRADDNIQILARLDVEFSH